jgi:signal peptidase I
MSWLAAIAVVAGISAWLARLRRRYLVVTVEGYSMTPTYGHGDRVLVRRDRRPRTGDVALVDLPEALRPIPPGVSPADSLRNRRVIKRVAASAGERTPLPVDVAGPVVPSGHLVLLGDNPDGSGDSRQYGYVPIGAVGGVVVRSLGAGS